MLNQIAVSLDEEEKITVVDVAGRARAAFDVDRVTKRFYDRFKAEHAASRGPLGRCGHLAADTHKQE